MEEKIYTIGRASDNNTRIDKPEVGRYHARITVNDDGVFLEDLDSVNGTYINGFRIKEAILNYRDKVVVAKKYPLSEIFLISLFRHKNPDVDPNDYSEEFLKLKDVYDDYQINKKVSIQKFQQRNNWIRLLVVTVPAIALLVILKKTKILGDEYFTVYIAATAILTALAPLFLLQENKNFGEIERKFKKKYKCPKCKLMLTQEWEIHLEDEKCPRCGALWAK
ncbi:MAG: FHA domain-containing protein [Bacteroidales bacterium]|jgi:pSer/pThr/pTyr-binding forkhead associated (FHA) protein|nr:FHA domain-containing protein [Bacteroidales bacterium]